MRDFIPVKDSNEKFGMYDLVSNHFYPSASSTQFTGGTPVIGSACNNGSGVLAVQQNLYDTAIVRYKGCLAASGTYPYSDTETHFLNVFFNVEPNTSYTYTTTTAGTRDGIYEYNNVFNPDDYTQEHQIVPDMVIQSGTTGGKYASGTFTTSADAKMIMYYGSNDWPTTPKGLTIYPTDRPIGTVYCDTTYPVNGIKIATTAYNAARFCPVVTDLDNAVATIREIVTKTINQTAAIASLQADKQTRPEDACPAGKKCLLVEDNNGKPHWFPIIENICGVPSGYTCLEYIQSSGTQYIDTGVVFDSGSLKFETDVYVTANITSEEDFIGNFTGSTLTAGFVGGFAGVTFLYSSSPNINVPRIKQNSWQKYIGEFTNSNQMILTYDGTTVSATRTKQHNSSPIVLFRGSESYKPAAHIRLGIVSIYLNNTMVRNFVPAKRNSDGAIGMYDLTNLNPATAFYTNSGTGTFTAGPEM